MAKPRAAVRPRASAKPATKAGSAQRELQKRLAAQTIAKQGGNSSDVANSSSRLIALALRELGMLRTLESAWPQAVELYKQSLQLEEDPAARVDLAIAYLKARQPSEAIFETERTLFSYPDNARAWHVQGEAYLLQKNWAKGTEALRKSVEIRPDLNALYSLGAAELMQKNKDGGAAAFAKIIEQGDSAALHVLFGDAYGEAEFKEESIREYKKAAEMNPEFPHVHFFLGLGYLMRDEWAPSEEALQALQEEVKRYPTGYFGNYYLGVIESTYNRIPSSNKHLEIAARAKPQWPESWLYLGLNAAAEQNTAKTEEFLKKAIDLTGSDEGRNNYQIVRAYFTLGRLEIGRGNKQKGSELLARAREMTTKRLNNSQQNIANMAAQSGMGGGAAVMPIQVSAEEREELRRAEENVDPTAELDASVRAHSKLTAAHLSAVKVKEKELRAVLANGYNDWGTAIALQQDYQRAFQLFLEAEKWDSSLPGIQRNVGLAAFRAGNFREAARALQVEAQRAPNPRTLSMLAASLFSSGQLTESAKEFGKLGDAVYADPRLAYSYAFALAATKHHREASAVLGKLTSQNLSGEMLLQIGQVYGDIGDNERALSCFHKAVQQESSLKEAHYNAGLVLIKMDRPEDAIREFETALAASPSDPNTQYNMAYALIKAGQLDRAITQLKDLLSSNPSHALGQYQLGKVLLESGHAEEAIQRLEKAAELDSNKDFIHYQLQAAYRRIGRIEDAERELALYKELKARNRQQTLPMPGDPQPD